MKKRYIILIVIASIFVLLIAALKATPIVARNYIQGHSDELIGRRITIESISFSPFQFLLEIDGFTLYEQDKKTPFVSFDKFRVNLNPTHLIKKEISISEIYLGSLYAEVIQNGDQFNFTDIINKFTPPDDSTKNQENKDSVETKKEDGESSFKISIKNIVFEKGNIIYQDNKVGSKFHVQNFSVNIPAVYFSNQNTDVGVNLKFADGGDLNVKLLYNMESSDFKLALELNQFALSCIKPYLNDAIHYKDFSGMLGIHLNVDGNVNNPLASNINGKIALDNITLTETSEKTLNARHVGIGIKNVNVEKNSFNIDSVIVDGASAHFDMYKNGQNNFDVLLKASAETPTAEKDTIDAATINKATDEEASVDSSKSEKPLQFFLNKLQLKNIAFTLNDQTIVKPFSYKVSDISVTGSNINFDTPCALHIGAAFPDGGTLSVKYKGAISNTSTMDLYVGVKNLSLKHFTPYTYHYTGYPISSGTLAFASDNKLVNDDIESRNTIDIYNIDVADKDPSASPEFNVPMKLGLYILKDKNDKIQFDVPIKGNLNDPEFSYFKIIWKTISNLLVKVALSPLKVVSGMAATGASAVGLDLGKSDEILFDPLNQNMESEQYAKAAKVVESIAKDPNLRISFVQNFPLKKTLEAYKIRKLKTDFYKALHGKTSLNELDEKSIIAIDDSDSTYTAYAAEHEASLDIKSLEKELLDMASRRSQELQKTLLQQKGISSKNVTVKTASKGELARFRGKAAFKINLDVK